MSGDAADSPNADPALPPAGSADAPDAEPHAHAAARRAQRVNWEGLRERLAGAADTLAGDAPAAAARAQAVLDERARALARPLDAGGVDRSDGGAGLETLIVRVGDARYAVPVTAIAEVTRPGGLTPLPSADPPVVAVLAWRGRMLAVMDLEPALGGSARGLTAHSRVVVIGEGRGMAGLLVNAVEDVQRLDAGALHPRGAGGGSAGVVAGVTADAVAVLDVAALLDPRAG